MSLWFGIKPAFVPRRNRFYNLNCWLSFWVNKWKHQGEDFKEPWIFVLVTLYHIWSHRNQVLWAGSKPNVLGVIRVINDQVGYIVHLLNQENNVVVPSFQPVHDQPHFSDCLRSNSNWVAMNFVKRNGMIWGVAVMGKGNSWNTLFSYLLCKVGATTFANSKVSPKDLLEFLRNVLLHWNDGVGGHLFLHPPSLNFHGGLSVRF